MSKPPAVAQARSRLGAVMALGVLVLSAGLGAAAQFGYSYYGTTWLANRQKVQDLGSFRSVVPKSPNQAAPLHTDLATNPPPSTSTVGENLLGVLYVPSWMGGVGVYGEATDGVMLIKEGTSEEILNSAAAGHYTGTALPGQIGNFSVAAHRRTYGDSFFRLPELQAGDLVGVETANAWYVYRVTGHDEVLPTEWQVVAPVPGQPDAEPTQALITMTTCNSQTRGAWGHDHRWVVHGELVGWVEHDLGIPAELQPGGGTA